MAHDAKPSLGALYDENAHRPGPAMPSIPGSSLGSAYESWFEAEQEARWLEDLERRRALANSDATQVISRADVEAYRERMEQEKSWVASTEEAVSLARSARTQEIPRPGKGGSSAVGASDTGDTGDATAADATAALPIGDPAEAGAQTRRQTAADEATAGTASRGGLLRSSAIMAAGTLVSRILGLLRSVLTAAALGATGEVANAWDVANTLPNVLYLLLAGGVINAVLVPQITRALDHSDGGKAYTDRIITLSLTLLLAVTAIFMAAAPLVYRIWDNNNMTPDKAHVTTMFTLLCLPQVFFYGVYTVFGQVLNARGKFGAFMWSPALANVVIIIGLVAFIASYPHGTPTDAPRSGVPGFSGWTNDMIVMLALPATLGIAVQAVALVPALRRAGYTFSPNFRFRGVGLRSASTMAGWAFAAVVVQQVGLIVTTQLLGSQPNGEPGKAAQSFAFLLFTLPHSLVTLSLVTALFTRMSVAAGRGETQKVKEDISTGVSLSGIASIMVTFGSFAVIFPLVRAMFGADESTVWSIGSTAIAMMVGLVPFSFCLIIQRVFYAYNDARTPLKMQLYCTGLAIALTLPWFNMEQLTTDWFGSPLVHWTGLQGQTILGHPGTHWVGVGVGLAQTFSNTLQAAVGFVLLRKKIGPIHLSEAVRTYVRLSVAAIAATIPIYLIFKVLGSVVEQTRIVSLLEISVIGVIFLGIYVLVAKQLRVKEIQDLLNPVMRRLGRA